MIQIHEKATNYLQKLKRIETVSDEILELDNYVLLLPAGVDILYTCDNVVTTNGLGKALDSRQSDLVTLVKIKEPLDLEYDVTNILTTRTYTECSKPALQIVSVQAVLLSQVTQPGKEKVLEMINRTTYAKTPHDTMWIGKNTPEQSLQPGETVIIMNRRIGGWDGSPEQPVIELLGAGGHTPTVWDDDLHKFRELSPTETLVKEFDEELGYSLTASSIDVIGGFHNAVSNELVILCCVIVPFHSIVAIQKVARGNLQENIDGIYMGLLEETINSYLQSGRPYAGGEKAKRFNFPSQPELMKRLYQKLHSYKMPQSSPIDLAKTEK